METSKTNQTWITPQYFHTIPMSCAILRTAHHKTLHMLIGLFTSTTGMHNYTPTRHSTLLTQQPSPCKTTVCAMFSSNKSSDTLTCHTCRLSTAYALYSFCIQDRPHLPCWLSSNPQHDFHAHQHALSLPSTTLQITNTRHSKQNGSRSRDDVKVLLLWLVFEGSIPTCACFRPENFCDFHSTSSHGDMFVVLYLTNWQTGAVSDTVSQ